MKLALYLPNFRDAVTVKELEDLTQLAEDLVPEEGARQLAAAEVGLAQLGKP